MREKLNVVAREEFYLDRNHLKLDLDIFWAPASIDVHMSFLRQQCKGPAFDNLFKIILGPALK